VGGVGEARRHALGVPREDRHPEWRERADVLSTRGFAAPFAKEETGSASMEELACFAAVG
jgi:hypothetical protein|tara:strand:+ start:4154 stop:4333 length:180 start_codon:yes stop_codon:yes gene_type:complete